MGLFISLALELICVTPGSVIQRMDSASPSAQWQIYENKTMLPSCVAGEQGLSAVADPDHLVTGGDSFPARFRGG